MQLQKDGLILDLYYYLWMKDDFLKNSNDYLKIRIPDTVIIKNSLPCYWFFTSRDGLMKKKNQQKLNFETIFKSFCQDSEKSGCCAYYMSEYGSDQEDEKDKFFRRVQQRSKIDENTNVNEFSELFQKKITIQYFNKEQLQSFLFQQNDVVKQGILQKFLEPEGDQNSCIQIIWSQNICLYNQCTNKNKFYEQEYDAYERLVTFDGGSQHSHQKSLKSNHIMIELKETLNQFAKHLSDISFNHIEVTRLVAYFKKDKYSRMTFLFCSSLRQNNKIQKSQNKPMMMESSLQKPDFVKNNITIYKNDPCQLAYNLKCMQCLNFILIKNLYPVDYKFIILSYDQQQKQEPNKIDSQQIPPIISKLHPNLKLQEYLQMKKYPNFITKQIKLCLDCYMNYSYYMNYSGKVHINSNYSNVKSRFDKIKETKIKTQISPLSTEFSKQIDQIQSPQIKNKNYIQKNYRPFTQKLQNQIWTSYKMNKTTNLSQKNQTIKPILYQSIKDKLSSTQKDVIQEIKDLNKQPKYEFYRII